MLVSNQAASMSSNSATTTDRVHISVPATSKANEKHAPSDAQELPQTGAAPAEKASENTASIRSRRSSNKRLVATALDFYSDGTCKLHETHARPCQSHELPPIPCPIQPNTLRVIFFDTHDVFENPSRALSSSRSDLSRNADCQDNAQLTTCEHCTKAQILDLSAQAMSKLQDLHQQRADPEPGTVGSTAQDSVSETVPKSAPTLPEKATGNIPTLDVEETVNVNSIDAPCPKPSTKNAADEQASIGGRATSQASSLLRVEPSATEVSNDHHKTYRGAYGITSLELFALWDRSSHDVSLPLGSNIISQAETPTEMDRVLARTAVLSQDYSMIHSLNLKGQMYRFYTIPASVRYSWQSQALQVECRWLKLDRHAHVQAPLATQFWNNLCSGDSAINLYHGDLDLGARLLTFDLLSAAITSWIEFLTVVRRRSSWESRLVGLNDITPMIGDREHLMDFSRASRDLVRAMEVTKKAIELNSSFCQDRKLKFDMLLLRQKAAHQLLDDLNNDIQQNADNTTSKYESLTNESQEASLRRLTLVASVFLPLSLACGLLSMTQRVTEVGAIWWDWFGIVVIIALAVIIPYRVYSSWYEARRHTTVSWVLKLVGDQWAKAKEKVLEDDAKRHWTLGKKSLIPWVTRYSYRACKYLFLLAATVSFLVGIFVSVATGSQALGYSAAGTAGFLVAAVGTFRFVQLAGYLLRRKKDDDDHGNEPEARRAKKQKMREEGGNQGVPADTDFAEGEKQEKHRQKRLPIGSLLWMCCGWTLFLLIITPVLLGAGLLACVFGFFFGWNALSVAKQALKNLKEQYWEEVKGDTSTRTNSSQDRLNPRLERPDRRDTSDTDVGEGNDLEREGDRISGSSDSEAGEEAVEGRRRRRTWTRSFDFSGPRFLLTAVTFSVHFLHRAVISLGSMRNRRGA